MRLSSPIAHCFKPRPALRVILLVVAAASLCVATGSSLAEDQKTKPSKTAESPNAQLIRQVQAQQMKVYEESLHRLLEQARANDPTNAEAQKEIARIFDLQSRVLKLSQGEQNE